MPAVGAGVQGWKAKRLAMCVGVEEANINQEIDIKCTGYRLS